MHFIQKLEPGTFCVPQLTHSSGAAATIPAAPPRVGVAHKRGGSAAERYKGPGPTDGDPLRSFFFKNN